MPLEVHKLNLKYSHRSRVSHFILHKHPLHSQDAHKLVQADEKLWYPRADKIQSNNNNKKKNKFLKSYKLILQAKDVNSVLRYKCKCTQDMQTAYKLSLLTLWLSPALKFRRTLKRGLLYFNYFVFKLQQNTASVSTF